MRADVRAALGNARAAVPEREKSRRKPGAGHTVTATTAVPLRFMIVVLIVLISGGGLFGSSVAVSSIMRDVVYNSVDHELEDAVSGWALDRNLFRAEAAGQGQPTDYVVTKIYRDGSSVTSNKAGGAPDLDQVHADGRPRTVSSAPSSPAQVRWRVLAVSGDEGVTTVVAKSLYAEETILARLTVAQITINLGALVLLAGLGYFLTSWAMRPLREVERTAGRIAAGEHDRRLPNWPDNTEVGQLAHSLNIMLERLQHSIREAQDKEDQMRRFVGDASHELRTPLTSVRGYAELYRSGAIGDADRVLGKIDEESKRMSLLVEDLLALTRAEGQTLEMGQVDLLELCLSVAGSARAAFPGRTIEVVNRTNEVPIVRGDQPRLHQCLLNLVTNGLRHGGADAAVTLRLIGDEECLRIEVADDGRGMTEKDAEHIFERFYRADTSRSRASGGSGLGLAITKSLVEKHGGTITVDSSPGQGAVFTIRLKRLADSAEN